MSDPLDQLRLSADNAADPPAAFVNALEARVRAALDPTTAIRRHPSVSPAIAYDDAPAAIRWLEDVLGFRTSALYVADDGGVNYSQLVFGDGAVTVHTRHNDPRARSNITLSVEDRDAVDRAFERARAAGASILREPEDMFYGGRVFGVEDPEGNHWHIGSPWLDSETARSLPERRV